MTETNRFEVHSEARGPRWIGWVALPGELRPWREVVLVAASRDDAEARARKWAAQQLQGEDSAGAGSAQ